MIYTVKEIFRTLQGEGGQMGRVAVFCRFAGCNLWSGRERDRATAACRFCDTDFVGGEKYLNAAALAERVAATWEGDGKPLVVLTGGEPMLQVDGPLVRALHEHAFDIALETNGTLEATPGIDWICVSPKTVSLRQTKGSELKLVFPQDGIEPAQFAQLEFDRFSLSPMAGPMLEQNTRAAIAYCLAHPTWRLTYQAHKAWGIQ